jgi:phosphoglucomutase
VQSIFNAMPKEEYDGKTLVVSGDGRFYNDVAIQLIVQIAVANGVSKVVVGQHGLLSTPAVSHLIRSINKDGSNTCVGGVLLTASHNPGGETEDFGIKFNGKNGGPAQESLTDEMFSQSKQIKEYSVLKDYQNIDIEKIGVTELGSLDGQQR